MLEFPIPNKFNGATFLKELAASGVETDFIPKEENGILYLDLDITLENKVTEILSKHDGSDLPDPKMVILEKLGITAEEAKFLLA